MKDEQNSYTIIMLNTIITSKARIRLLLKFFINPAVRGYLRGLATEFNESTNAVRVELNRLVDAKLLKVEQSGRNKYYSANTEHPLYPEISRICHKTAGLDKICDFLAKLGQLTAAYVVGDYARGIDSGIIDLVVVGDANESFLNEVIHRTEESIGRRIRLLMFKPGQEADHLSKLKQSGLLPVWQADGGAPK